MSEHTNSYLHVGGISVIGASHIRDGKPCQDAILFHPTSGIVKENDVCILVLADGHGSRKSPNSDKGAEFAVEVGLKWLNDFSLNFSESSDSFILKHARDHLAQGIVREWINKVLSYESNQSSIDESNKTSMADIQTDDILLKYGSTFIGILVTNNYTLYLQLGDGDVLAYTIAGEVIHPIPRDESLIANETTSLCSKVAWSEFRVAVHSSVDTMPDLILASTDGYSNSFTNNAEFEKICPDYFEMIEEEGWDAVMTNLADWLSQASKDGSGDDITLGVIYKPRVTESKTDKSTENSEENVFDAP